MPPPAPRLSRRASKLLNKLVRLCWLVPVKVEGDERIIRAIYSPHHVDRHNRRLKHQAYDPTPGTDEISTMRLEHMGASFCRKKAKSFQNLRTNPPKIMAGLAVLQVATVTAKGMPVVDSRRQYCGHADIKLLIAELLNRQKGEPPPPHIGKKFKDLKDELVKSSTYFSDPNPREKNRRNREFLRRVENWGFR
jgi:hypothetical protein